MNPWFARFLSSVCRKEPLSGFLLIFGITDILIGGIGGRWNLFSVGLFFALLGLWVRYLRVRRIKSFRRRKRTIRYALPPRVANPPLPLLVRKKTRR